jgi:hypothetical protein
LNEKSRLITVVWDASPPSTRITITLHDFYWPDGQDLVLTNIPVSS